MTNERRLKALEKRVERLDTEVWDLLKVLRDTSGALFHNAEHMEARHCADWKRRHPILKIHPKRKKK